AADAVAARLRAEIDDGPADARGGGVEDGVRLDQAGREGVDEAVAVIGRVEADLAADGGDAEGVSIAADPGDDPGDQRSGLRVRGLAEAERVQAGDGARAHGEDVAQDPADA